MHVKVRTTRFRQLLWWLPGAMLAIGLAACGSGGSSSTPMTPTGSAKTRVAIGSITGFGSVHVNGVKFQTTSARITVNGRAATQSDLRVGHVVEVHGHRDASGQDVADTIDFRHNVQGPVSMIDVTAGKLVVLGQTVLVSADTSFGDGVSPASLAGLAVGDIVEVSGMVAANGDIQATRIEKEAAGSPFEVTGIAASTDPTAKTLKINALTVSYGTATLVNFPSTGPKDGDRVEARGTTLGAGGELVAARLELVKGDDHGEANEDGEIEGLISRFASATDFDVSGHPVTTSTSTIFEGGTSADLALNVRVEAEGSFDAAGVLVATRIRIRLQSASATHLVGAADAVDATAGTVTVLGVTVSVTDMTRFEDHESEDVSTFKLADVYTGDWLDIRGGESPAGSNKVVATRLERIPSRSSACLAGTVKTAAQPAFTILSVNVTTTPTTVFSAGWHQAITADAFFTNLVGQRAAVCGSWDAATLTAQKATLGDHDEEEGGD